MFLPPVWLLADDDIIPKSSAKAIEKQFLGIGFEIVLADEIILSAQISLVRFQLLLMKLESFWLIKEEFLPYRDRIPR